MTEAEAGPTGVFIPMPVNEPGEYLDAPDLAYFDDLSPAEQRRLAPRLREQRRRRERSARSRLDDPGE